MLCAYVVCICVTCVFPCACACVLSYYILSGLLRHPPHPGPQTTSETRLISEGTCGRRQWDNRKYEDQLFYFNTESRVHLYEHGLDTHGGEGLDRCYDCTAEIFVLREYLKNYRPELPEEERDDEVWILMLLRLI